MMILNTLQIRRTTRCSLGFLSLSAILAMGLTAGKPVHAQDTAGTPKPPAAPSEKVVSLDAEDATLASVITTLMQNVGASYTLDNSLRTIRVTAHLHNIRLDIALDILLRNATPPLTYRYENGVYSFLPKVESPPLEIVGTDNAPQPVLSGLKRIQVTRVNFIDAAVAAQILGGIPIRAPEGQTYGLVDPLKLTGAITSPITGGAGNGGNAASGGGLPPVGGNTPGGNGQNSTLPANLFDYLWIVNVGAIP